DSESNPFAAAMPWIVKLDKEQDWIGKWALQHYSEQPSETALVGFTLSNGHVPTEGAVVMPENGSPLGQVIGMAWVPAALAQDGARITISDEDVRIEGEVQTKPFYDPDGEILRS